MNRLLLDTQALLWFLLDDPRISENAKERIIDDEAVIFVSPASLWEIAIKISLGKYELSRPFNRFWDEQLAANDFSLLPITVNQVAHIVNIPFHHRDPFDRLIIAQAIEENISIVSSDQVFEKYPVERVW